MKRIHIIIVSALALIVVSSFLYIAETNGQEIDRQNIINEIRANLVAKGVPIKQAQVVNDTSWNPPVLIDYSIQSSSQDDKLSPGDTIYISMIVREVNLAQRRGLNFGAVGVNIINGQGKVIFYEREAPRNIEDLPGAFVQPSKTNYGSIFSSLNNLPRYGLSLDRLDLVLNNEGLYECGFDLQASDVQTASVAIPSFIGNTRAKITDLNLKESAQIAIYRINISGVSGEPLLKYHNDLQLTIQTWWQNDSVTQSWFPHPKPME